jgi:hypothetical protein
MIFNVGISKLLDVAVFPDVSGAVPFFVVLLIGCGIALVAGAALLLYFLVFKKKK